MYPLGTTGVKWHQQQNRLAPQIQPELGVSKCLRSGDACRGPRRRRRPVARRLRSSQARAGHHLPPAEAHAGHTTRHRSGAGFRGRSATASRRRGRSHRPHDRAAGGRIRSRPDRDRASGSHEAGWDALHVGNRRLADRGAREHVGRSRSRLQPGAVRPGEDSRLPRLRQAKQRTARLAPHRRRRLPRISRTPGEVGDSRRALPAEAAR